MNAFVNYLIEVNLGLVFFYAIYWVLLRNENLVIKTLQLRVGYYPGIPGDGSGLQFEIRGINLLEFLDFKPKPPRVIRYK